MKRAFTLVELIIVVIIIGILASIAIPQFNKTMERSRIAEASAVLGSLRGAQLRYKLENTDYATDTTKIDIDLPMYEGVANSGKFFDYDLDGEQLGTPVTATAIAMATRKSTSQYGQYVIKITDQGKIYCADTATDACAGFVSQ